MQFPHLSNLRSQSVKHEVAPWAFAAADIPETARANKAARDLWICNPKTEHHVYSAVDGFNPSMRVNRGRDESGNPPHALFAIVVDYDCPTTLEQARDGWGRAIYRPTWWETTLSGNGRAVWCFEQPVLVPGYEFTSKLIPFLADKVGARMVAPGVDEGALKAPERYYTNSGQWTAVPDSEPLRADLVLGWLVEFSAKFSFTGKDFGVELPLDRAAELLAKKYPRFADWPGDFSLGSQGPSFWIEGSTSPKSAIVRETGIQTFAAHATRGFYLWEDLLGKDAVENFRSNQLGAAVAGVYFDSKSYHRAIATGRYVAFGKEDTVQFLRTMRGLSQKADKTGISQIDKAISFIHEHQFVVGAAPFAYQPTGLIRFNGDPVLNTSTKRALAPQANPTIWGSEGDFPFISSFLDALFDPVEQKEVFLSWLSVFYKSAHAQKPASGQNLFLAGGASVGKTLLTRRIIGGLLGGFAEASDYLLGKDGFGSELFENGVWCVDDSESTANAASHRKFSEIVKRMAANNTFRYHAKFRVPLLVDWRGRVCVTMNRDEESIRMLPDMSLTVMDKTMLFRARDSYKEVSFRFPKGGANVIEAILDRELPAFARYVLDYVIPANLLNELDPRYTVKAYHDETLLGTALQSSSVNAFAEILHDWRAQYFGENPKETAWEGTSFQLHKTLHADATATAALRTYSLDAVSRALSALKNRGDGTVSCRETGGLRLWKILPLEKPTTVTVPEEIEVNGSRFQK